MTEPRIFRVLFPHGNYEINENTGEQTVPMLDMGLLKINDEAEPSFNMWAKWLPKHSVCQRFILIIKTLVLLKTFVSLRKQH